MLLSLGQPTASLELLERALATCDLVDLNAARSDAMKWRAAAMATLGRTEEAIEVARSALAGSRSGITFTGQAQMWLGVFLTRIGEVEDGRREARIATETLAFAPSAAAEALALLARIELEAGDIEAARSAALRAEQIVEGLGVIASGEAVVYCALAEVHEAFGDADRREAAIAKGVASVRRRAACISDPELRRSYERVADNAWLLDRA